MLRRKSRSQFKAKLSHQIPASAFMARLGRATAKSQRSSLAPMVDPLGTRQICSVNRNQTPGDFGNSIGKPPAYGESKLSLLAQPIRWAKRNRCSGTLIEAHT